MYRSPDVLTALRISRRNTPPDHQRVPHEPAPIRTVRRGVAFERGRPDYGCVDWFVYEERSEQERSS